MSAQGDPIVMPKLGLTMSEGTVAEWLVTAGQSVSAGQTIFVVETDKISHEIEAAAAGEIGAVLVAAGETVPVGTIVATYATVGDATAPRTHSAPAMPDAAATVPVPVDARRVVTPLARRLAAAAEIDLAMVMPSGAGHRIKARDILAAVAARTHTPPAPAAALPAAPPASASRRRAAERLTRSKTEIPHFYIATPVDIARLERLRKELNGDTRRTKISVTHFLVAAIGRAMAARRHLNAVWRDGADVLLDDVAVGVAVDTDHGVRMPVIRGADHRPLDHIAASIHDAAERARAGRLRATDIGQAAISLSNVGMFGVTALVPIIDPDQSFIIGVGAPQDLFRPGDDGAPVARREITLTLAADHRLVDGAAGAALLRAVADRIEAPLQLMRAGAA